VELNPKRDKNNKSGIGRQETEMQLCFVGTPSCGKSTLVTLLHLRANELLMKKKKFILSRNVGYRSRGTRDDGLDLDMMADKLRHGYPVPATPPVEGVRQALMLFSFRTWFVGKRDLGISVVDSGGELQQELFELLPEGLKWSDDAFEKIRIRTRVSRQQYEQFIKTVFDSEAFLFVIDAKKAFEQAGRQDGARQDRSLATFIRNIHAYKELNVLTTPRLKGFGIFLTRLDKVPQLANIDKNLNGNNGDLLETFISQYLVLGRAALQSLCDDFKIKPMLFYHMLNEAQGYGQKDAPWYKVSSDKLTIEYSRDQYNSLIKWFRTLVKKKYDYCGPLI